MKVIIVQPIAEAGVEKLKNADLEIEQLEDPGIENLKQKVVDADAILVRTAHITREVIERGNKLKVIAGHGTGTDNIDVEAATEKGIRVVNTPAANSHSVAEHVIGMMIVLAKKMRQADIAARQGKYEVRDIYINTELKGKNLSIIGLGKIGSKVGAKAARGLEMNVIGYDPYFSQEEVGSLIELNEDWEDTFKKADFVSLNMPLTEETEGIVGAEEFEIMKDSAHLINCARGPIVKEKDLIEALNNNIIAGAGIDVYTEEPPKKSHPFFQMDNTVVTPHMASHSQASMNKMATHSAQGVIEVLNGEEPTWPVN